MAYIFTQGQCRKKEIYDLLINSLLSAGWQNISSNVADGEVMYSTGMSGDSNLYIQLFPYDTVANGQSAANYNNTTLNVRTGIGRTVTIRLPMGYTPGMSGSAGTLKRPAQSVFRWLIINSNADADPDLLLTYDLYVDKNKLIAAFKAPDWLSLACGFIYLGCPDTLYVKAKDSRCVLCASVPTYGPSANRPVFSDCPDKSLGSSGDIYAGTYQCILPTYAPNVNGSYFLCEPYLNSDSSALIGKMDGVYVLPNDTRAVHGDIITMGNSKFKILRVENWQSGWGTLLPTNWVAIQIA